MSERKTGVYICTGCGIGESLSVDGLEKVAVQEYRAPKCVRHDFLCGDAGRKAIEADLASGEVNQLVIAACSPRVMTDRFRFDGTFAVRANLREQVIWVQPPGQEDTQMAGEDQIRIAMTQIMKSAPPEPMKAGDIERRILVVGGGIAGLTAALNAVKAGHEVLLVERSDRLGGQAGLWSKIMPSRPPYREPQENPVAALVAKVQAEPRIKVKTNCVVAKTAGMPGRFEIDLDQGGTMSAENVGAIVVATGFRPYDATKLGHLGYGASPDVVTGVELEAMLKEGKIVRRSDSRPIKNVAFVQCAGSRDEKHLPYCSSVCCRVSIKQALQLVENDPETMAYVIFEELRTPGVAEEFYRAAQEKGVIFVKGKVSGVGADLTITYKDELLGDEIPMQGLDLVVLATGMVPNSTDILRPTPDLPPEKTVLLKDDIDPQAAITVAGYKAEAPAARERPDHPLPEGAPILNLQYRQGPHIPILADGFADSHYICFPYETRRTGIYTCGPVRRPMDMAETAEDATGAVMKAIQAIKMAEAGGAVHPRVGDLSLPKIGLSACTKCRRCTVECPFGAIDETDQDFPSVNASRCRRCGTCMGACPVRTISFDNYSVEMLVSMIKAVKIPDEFANKPRVLILACENDAYPAIDMAGLARLNYSAFVRVIPVRCLGSVSLMCVSSALEVGYDGVALMGCKSGDDYQCHFVKGSAIAKERMSKVGETLKSMMLEPERVGTIEVAISESHKIPAMIDKFVAVISAMPANPFKGF